MKNTENSEENRRKEIGNKIKEARQKAELSQKQLADLVGFESATAISLIESGDRKVDIPILENIAKHLKQPIDFFLGNEPNHLDFSFALRADKQLDLKDQKQILDFIDFLKKNKSGK